MITVKLYCIMLLTACWARGRDVDDGVEAENTRACARMSVCQDNKSCCRSPEGPRAPAVFVCVCTQVFVYVN